MNFKTKILSKSNQYNYYKEGYEKYKKKYDESVKANNVLTNKLDDANNELKNVNKLNDDLSIQVQKLSSDNKQLTSLRRSELNATSFCNKNLVNYIYRDDFPSILSKFVEGLSDETRHEAIRIFSRAIAASFLRENTLFSPEELEEQKKHLEFKEKHVSGTEICGFKFKNNNFNMHCFMNDFLTDDDKEFIKDKDIIDAGAFVGDSSIPFSLLTSKDVHAFEPFKDSYDELVENIEMNNIKNIVSVNASLSNHTGKENLFLSGSNFQGITSDASIRRYDEVLTVNTVSVDEYVEKNNLNVGFIKVDVEGGEQNLIKGAINTIKSQKPILLLSIYHTPDDFFGIKSMIDDLNLGYSFKISKERPWAFLADTILECRCND